MPYFVAHCSYGVVCYAYYFHTIRRTPIRVRSVVVVDITRRIDIPCIVGITAIRGTQTNILRVVTYVLMV